MTPTTVACKTFMHKYCATSCGGSRLSAG